MADEIAVELRVKNKQLANDLRAANVQIAKMEKNFLTLGNTGAASLKKTDTAAAKTAKSVGVMAAALKVAAAISGAQVLAGWATALAGFVSEVQSANNQLKSLGLSTEETARLQKIALRVANETGLAYKETATTIARISRALEEFGGTTDQAAIITDSLNKSLLLTGATGAEATSALTQFSQALQSGILQGDELRSLRENAPAVIRAIAKEMGIATSQIKKAGEDGKITVDIITKALLEANADLTEQTANIPLTLDRSLTVASNNIKDFLTNNENVTALIEDLSLALFEATELLLKMADGLTTTGGGFDQATQDITGLTGGLDLLTTAIGGVVKAFYSVAKTIKLVLDVAYNGFSALSKRVGIFAAAAVSALKPATNLLLGIFTFDRERIRAGLDGAANNMQNFIDSMGQSVRDGLDADIKDFEEWAVDVVSVWDNAAREVKKIDISPDGDIPKLTPDDDGKKEKKVKKDTTAIDAYNKALQALLSTQYDMSTASQQAIADYNATILAIEQYKIAAVEAGQAINEALVASVEEVAVKKVEKTLDDLQVAWIDLSTALDENGLKIKAQDDLWKSFVVTGLAAGKSMEEVTAAFKKFGEDSEAIKKSQEIKALMGEIRDEFQSAAESIIFDSESAGEALKNLAKEVGKLILQFLILKAVQGLSGGGAGAATAGASSPSTFGFNSSPTIRVYNYGATPGGVQARSNSSGGVDIIINQIASAVGKGGNALDSALRRTYGIGRVGQ